MFTGALHWSLLNQMNPVHVTQSYFSKIHSNIILKINTFFSKINYDYILVVSGNLL
jgi:hypothetical protein